MKGWRRTGAIVAAMMLAGVTLEPHGVGAKQHPGMTPQAKPEQSSSAGYRSAIVVDAGSGEVLFEKDSHRPAPPASMTKMMLMLIVAERVHDGSLRWDDPIVTSAWASKIGGSQVYLKQGEIFPLQEMMQAIVIHSANDASVAVAETVAGSSEAFVDLMNQRAKALGMRETTYHSVHGLPPGKGQQPDMTSAADLATLARELVKYPEILKWAGTKEAPFREGSMTLTNTNRLVRETNWVDGLKTGYYREAGFNVTATAKRDDLRLIAVVMGDRDKHDCFAQAAKLLSKELAEYKALIAVKQGDTIASDIAVKGGKSRFVRVVAGGSVSVLGRKGDKRSFSLELALPGDVTAPLSANAPIGEVVVKDGDVVVGRVPALTADPVERQASLWDRLF